MRGRGQPTTPGFELPVLPSVPVTGSKPVPTGRDRTTNGHVVRSGTYVHGAARQSKRRANNYSDYSKLTAITIEVSTVICVGVLCALRGPSSTYVSELM